MTGFTLPMSSRIASSSSALDDVVPVAAERIAARGAAINGMPNQNLAVLLAVTVDTAVALFHDIGIVGNLDVDEAITVVLKVDAFGRSIGGEQYAYRRVLRIGLERGFDLLAFFFIYSAMNDREAIAAISGRSEYLMQPLMRGAILREEYDAPVVPLSIRLQVEVRSRSTIALALVSVRLAASAPNPACATAGAFLLPSAARCACSPLRRLQSVPPRPPRRRRNFLGLSGSPYEECDRSCRR